MAPELFEGKENYGPKSDVYSFGLLAYQILTGKKPFLKKKKEISIESLIKDITSGVRPKPKKIKNSNMRKLISLCWSQNPEERPTFSEIFEKLRNDFTYFDDDANGEEINDFLEKTLKINQEQEEENEFAGLNDKQIIELQKKENQSYFKIIQNLIQTSSSVYDIYINFKPILFFACEIGNLKLVKYIISLDQLDLNTKDILNQKVLINSIFLSKSLMKFFKLFYFSSSLKYLMLNVQSFIMLANLEIFSLSNIFYLLTKFVQKNVM